MNKNDELVGIVTDVGANGEGIIKEEGFVIFLPFAFLGEKIRYKILKVKKNYAFGKVLEVLTPADQRVKPVCALFGKCGGCQLQHLKYSSQLKLKSKIVKDCFYKVAGLELSVPLTERSTKEYGYRNKLQIPVTDVGGETVIGFYAENSHRPIKTDFCPITDWSKDIIAAFKDYIAKFSVRGYNEFDNSGELRHIAVRAVDDKYIITAVSVNPTLRGEEYLIERLKKNFTNFSLYINVNDKPTNVIFGDKFRLIYGEGRYVSQLRGIKYEYGAQSFLQVNKEVSERIYRKAVELAAPNDKTVVIDAYSGAGLMTAMLAERAYKAYGVEIVAEAVECADCLKTINALGDKMENILGSCEAVLPSLISKIKATEREIAIVLDPPRKGCDAAVLEAVKNSRANRIVYISCNPATLARDVGILIGSLELKDGELKRAENYAPLYEITFIQPYDMFAQTRHIETLVCLSKKDIISHIEVDVEFGEGEGQLSLKD